MLLNQTDIKELFEKKCRCFGAVAAGGITAMSAGAVAANIAVLGAAISAVGMIQQGKAQSAQANFQAGVARNNAIIAEQQATRARQQAAIDEGDFRRDQSDLMASRRSLMGGLGITGAGSPLAVSSDFAGETEYNAQKVRNQGEVTANRLQQEAMNQNSQASLYGMQGRQAVTSSYYRAGGTLMSGLGSAMGGFKSSSAPKSSGYGRSPIHSRF